MLCVRGLLAHATMRCFSTTAPALPALAEVKAWDTARVVEFAEGLKLGSKAVSVLQENEINGKRLLNLTEDKLRADGMPRGPASDLATAIAELRGTQEEGEEIVTLTFKSKGGNPFPVDFTASDFRTYVSTSRSVFHMTKDGCRKGEVRTLAKAKSILPPDYLLLATPFDTVADLEGFARNHASGLEQQTTRSIAMDPALIKQYGALTALADGEHIIFYTADGKNFFYADGLVKNSVCLLFNEAKHSPSEDDIHSLDARAKTLHDILSDPTQVRRTSPPGIMDQLVSITKVVPVLCGFHFAPRVKALCRQKGITTISTDGEGFSIRASL